MKKISMTVNKFIADTALSVTKTNMNRTCLIIIHQPKMPEGAKKLRKF